MKSVAVIFGGESSEYNVSLNSANAIIKSINQTKHQLIMIGITKAGKWYLYQGNINDIANDKWIHYDNKPISIEFGKGLICENKTLQIDACFPVLHGKNGEDGTVQGLLELLNIKCIGCGVLSSALGMNKEVAHQLASKITFVSKSKVLTTIDVLAAREFALEVGYPFFVKPLRAGSSYGISKVYQEEHIESALRLAFQYDNQIIMEEFIDGVEVGCGIIGSRELMISEVDEIEIEADFFDYSQKYEKQEVKVYLPARFSKELRLEIKQIAKSIYEILDCKGFARIDMFVTKDFKIYFNEINTIPGFTEKSRFPRMFQFSGIQFKNLVEMIIETELDNE